MAYVWALSCAPHPWFFARDIRPWLYSCFHWSFNTQMITCYLIYTVYASASHLSISMITVMEKSLTTLEGSFEEITVKFCWKCLKSTLFFCWNCQLMQPKSGFLSQNRLSIMGHIQPKIHRPALGLLDPSPCLRQLFVVNKTH